MRYWAVMLLFLVTIPTQAAEYRTVVLWDVPHVRQKPDFCGEACAAMYLQKLGLAVDQDYVFDQSGLSPLEGRGCYTKELAAALKSVGFQPGPVWYSVDAGDAAAQLERQFATLHADLVRNVPSIICMHYNDQPNTTEHFRLILGYDSRSDEVLYHEPAEADGSYKRMRRDLLLKLWPLKYERDRWTVIRMPLVRGEIKPARAASTFTAADYAQHIQQLKKKIPEGDFHVMIQEPFVVIGDEKRDIIERRNESTIKWAVEKLKQDYFTQDPEAIIDIWLFKDKPSYDTNAETLFGSKPGTPFGYYSSKHQALVMNISTGGGTLVHEIVHPFIASNFPECPSWFNEGLASLYEACGEENGHIYGYTNWRLRGLQQAIKEKRVPPFRELCFTTTNEFYNEDKGTNYSQARYLCYYLQEKGLLVKYYHQFRKNVEQDPSGYSTLRVILKEDDMDDFQKRWEKYVSELE